MIYSKKEDDAKKKKAEDLKKKKEKEDAAKKEDAKKKKNIKSETAEMGNTTLDGELGGVALPGDIADNDITPPKKELPTSDKLDAFINTLEDEGDVEENVKEEGNDFFGEKDGDGSQIVKTSLNRVDQANIGKIKSKEGQGRWGVKWDDNTESIEDASELEKVAASCQVAVLQYLKNDTFRLVPFLNKKDNLYYTKDSYLIKSAVAKITRLLNKENLSILLKNCKILSKDTSVLDTTIKSNRYAYRIFSGNDYIFLLKGKLIGNSVGRFEWFKKIGSKYISESGKSFSTVIMQRIGKPDHIYVNIVEGKFVKSNVKYGFKSFFKSIEQSIKKFDVSKETGMVKNMQGTINSMQRQIDTLTKQNVLLSRGLDAKDKQTSNLKKNLLESRNQKFEIEPKVEIKSNVDWLTKSMKRI
jgi:hypothetical protein